MGGGGGGQHFLLRFRARGSGGMPPPRNFFGVFVHVLRQLLVQYEAKTLIVGDIYTELRNH